MGCNVDFYCTCYFLRVIRMELGFLLMKFCGRSKKYSDTGNRTPSCRVKGGNVSRYTISDDFKGASWKICLLTTDGRYVQVNHVLLPFCHLISQREFPKIDDSVWTTVSMHN